MARLDVATLMTTCKTMLGGLSAWQSLCNTTSATEATKRIYLGGVVANPLESTCPVCWLDLNPAVFDWAGTGRGRLTVEARYEIAVPETMVDDYQQQYLWVWERVADLMADINSNVNGSGGLMLRSFTMPLRPGQIDPADNDGRCEWSFTFGLVIELV